MKSIFTKTFLLFLAIWTLLGCLSAAMWIVQIRSRGETAPWPGLIVGEILYWYAWGIVMSLVVVRLARWFPVVKPIDAGHLKIIPLSLAVHLPMSFVMPFATFCLAVILSNAYTALTDDNVTFAAAFSLLSLQKQFTEQITGYYLRMQGAMMGVLTYWASLAMLAAQTYFSQMQMEATRRSQLETELARAELTALKMQVHPHFLFNTLNSISSLLQTDTRSADRMIARLGEFFRITLDSGQQELIPLDEEMHFARLYLEIEQVRFEDRLTFEIDIAPEAASILVPNLILQPIVENAIKHGIATQIAAGKVQISATTLENTLILTVADNGRGSPVLVSSPDGAFAFGVGLSNVSARLQQMYGSAASIQLASPIGGGFVVTLRIPFETR